MSFSEREFESEEEGSVCEDVVGGGGFRGWSDRDVQYEFGPGSEICRGSPRDDREDQGFGTESRETKKVIRRSGYQGTRMKEIRVSENQGEQKRFVQPDIPIF